MDDLKPMLLEVNSGPSLSIDSEQEVAPGIFEYMASPTDEEVKYPLVRDSLLLVLPKEKLRFWYVLNDYLFVLINKHLYKSLSFSLLQMLFHRLKEFIVCFQSKK